MRSWITSSFFFVVSVLEQLWASGFEDLPIDLAVVEILNDVSSLNSRCRSDSAEGT